MFVCPECGAALAGAGHCPADGTPLAPIGEDVLLGTTIGAYRVARLLGIGGMGRVYKGVHPQIGSRVAIKVLSRECSDRRELVDRFFAEAKAVNLIRHESIVNVLDLAVLPDGRPYIIMEYLDGAPLASIIEGAVAHGPALPLGGVARLAAEVLDALGAAHAKGIVHRDLKPDNIFVAPSGRPKVLDFGIAKLNDASHSATRTGSLLGTPHYMAPEQAAGRPVDHRADIYAMGVILFECATGQKPFSADSLFDLLRKQVEAPPPSPRALRPDLPPDLEHVILTALAKAPDHRFSSAQAMSSALQHATSQLPPGAWQALTPTATPTIGGGWAPTPPASWRPTPTSTPPSAPAPGNAPTVSAGQVTAPARSRGGKRALWIVLGLVVVGGGVTAAVVASSGDAGDDHPAAPAEAKPPAETRPPVEAKPTEPPPPPAEADSDDAVDDDDMKAAYAALGDAIKDLPPDVQKQMAQYKDIAKLPPKERMKKLRELTKLTNLGADLGNAPGWVENHDIAPPAGYDAEKVDVGAFVAWAVAAARREIPDAQLIRIDANGVSPSGRANLSLASLASDHGSIDVRFISPAHTKRDPKQPPGARQDWKCEFRVEATPSGVEVSPINGWDCSKEKPLALPRCSFAAVWKRALAKKAPSDGVGNLGYRADFGGHPTWYFDIGFGTDVAFSELFRDDC